STAVRLNDASEAGAEAKTGKVVASRTGGFHACYVINAGKLQYRRYVTSLTPPLTVHQDLIFNPHIAEGLNGDVHLVWENWAGDSPEVGWARSTNSGASFSPAVELSNTGGHAKFPYLAPMGMGTVGDMMLSYWNP